MPIICLYMYHYICINGRNHCNQGFTPFEAATSNKKGEACSVKKNTHKKHSNKSSYSPEKVLR